MPKRTMQGTVVSDKGDKTVTVRVERRIMHPVYKKIITKSKKFAAHDAENRFKRVMLFAFVNAHLFPSQRPMKWSMTMQRKTRRD